MAKLSHRVGSMIARQVKDRPILGGTPSNGHGKRSKASTDTPLKQTEFSGSIRRNTGNGRPDFLLRSANCGHEGVGFEVAFFTILVRDV